MQHPRKPNREEFAIYRVYAWGTISKLTAYEEGDDFYMIKTAKGNKKVTKKITEGTCYYSIFREAKKEALRRQYKQLRRHLDSIILQERLIEEVAMAEESTITSIGLERGEGST